MKNLLSHIQKVSKLHNQQFRKFDKSLPYVIHPVWCALTVLTEPLRHSLKYKYALALLYHDVLEDTMCDISIIPDEVRYLVEDMSFKTFNEEREKLFVMSDEVLLLKLYDKVSNLLDGHWMSDEKRKDYTEHMRRIYQRVKITYSNLNIIKMAEALL